MNSFKRRITFFLLLCGLTGFCACTPELKLGELKLRTTPSAPEAGDVINAESLPFWPRWVLKALFWWRDLDDRFPLEHGIALYRVTYWSEGPSGRLGPATGLMALPSTGDVPLKGLVSWQHDTATLKPQAPSEPDLYNGVFAVAIFAGAGCAMVAPDYLGFGASTALPAYYHTRSIAASVVNLSRAAHRIIADEKRQIANGLYLTDFSQGGHASYAAHRWIETEPTFPWKLRGTGSIGGPLDLAQTGFPGVLNGESRFGSLYVAWVALSYARVYGQPVTDILREPWASTAERLFDGERDGAPIIAALPKDPKELLTEPMIKVLQEGGRHWFIDRLTENSILDWAPRIPVRAYYGNKDVDVPTSDIIAMAIRAKMEGIPFDALSVGDYNHDESILEAAPKVLQWFDSMQSPH